MNLKKYLGQEVTIVTLASTGYRSWSEKKGDVSITQRENIEDNLIEGKVTDANTDSITIEVPYRGRDYRFEVNSSAVAWIMTSALNESGKAQSDRMKAQHAESKK